MAGWCHYAALYVCRVSSFKHWQSCLSSHICRLCVFVFVCVFSQVRSGQVRSGQVTSYEAHEEYLQ